MNQPTKTCNKCGRSQPEVKFGVHSATRDGLRNQCNACRWEYNRVWKDRRKAQGLQYRYVATVKYRKFELNKLMGLNRSHPNHTWQCAQCNIPHADPSFFDVDHVTPRHKGGPNSIANKQILCPNCHRIKSLAENREFLRASV